MGKTGITISKILTYILYVMLVLAVVGAILVVINEVTSESGMYVVYAEEEYYSDNDGIVIEWTGDSYTAEFTINTTGDWGVYSVEDCTVKVIPSVSDNKDFDITTTEDKNFKYSGFSDLTAAFTEDYTSYDGKGLEVDEDGKFSLYFDEYYTDRYSDTAMSTVLTRALYKDYGDIEFDTDLSDKDISSYPYFAIQIISPDSSSAIEIPFKVVGSLVFTITYSLTNCYVDGDIVDTVTYSDELTITFKAYDGYELFLGYFFLSDCDYDAVYIDGEYLVLDITNVTDDFNITVIAKEVSEEYSVSGTWYIYSSSFHGSLYLKYYPYVVNVNFVWCDTEYSSITLMYDTILFDDTVVYYYYDGWLEESYEYLNFGDEEQYVSEWFYDCLKDIAIPYYSTE